jgi:protease-4
MLDKMSDANKEQMTLLLSSLWDHILNKISISRNISTKELNSIADGFLARNATKATEYKLIDGAKYRDELLMN